MVARFEALWSRIVSLGFASKMCECNGDVAKEFDSTRLLALAVDFHGAIVKETDASRDGIKVQYADCQ